MIIARLDSSRLPGKALLPLGDRRLLDHVVQRAQRCDAAGGIWLATTDRRIDDPLAEVASDCGINVFRGELDDVAGRVLGCADSAGAATVVRVNGDSPFFPVEDISALLHSGLERRYEFISNLKERSFPYGVAIEIMDVDLLRRAHRDMTESDKEHVTRALYRRDDVTTLSLSRWPKISGARLVVDTQGDLDVCNSVVEMAGRPGPEIPYEEAATIIADLTTKGPHP